MAIGPLAKGTKENIHVDLDDRTDAVTELSGSGPTFDVIDSADVFKATAVAATASGLRITVLLDTNLGGVWAVGEYRLLVKFTVSTEVIRKGPFYFTIAE